MNEHDISVIINLWESGTSITNIIRMLPYDKNEVRQTISELRQKGVLEGRTARSSIKTREKVLSVYNKGITNPYEIADMLGLSHHTVKDHLVKAKLSRTRPKRNYKTCDKTQLIKQDLESGIKAREIAKKHGVSTQWVHQIRNKYIKE